MKEVNREALLKSVLHNLICTIGSADAPVTEAVLMSTYREDTNCSLKELTPKLGFSSINDMLQSEEFCHIFEPCYTNMAKGAGNENPKEVFCYRIIPGSVPRIAHVLSSIDESNQYLGKKEAEKLRKHQMEVNDPKSKESILWGRVKLMECLGNLGGEEEPVDLAKLQAEYLKVHGVEMKKELKQYFPTSKLKTIMDEYLYEDVELHEIENKSGTMLFKMKKSFAQVVEETNQISAKRVEAEKLEKEAEEKRLLLLSSKSKNKKKKKTSKGPPPPPQPKKLRVIKPVLKPKLKPIVLKMRPKPEAFLTDDVDLVNALEGAQEVQQFGEEKQEEDGDEDESEREEEEEEQDTSFEEEKSKKIRYTQMCEGAVVTDSEGEEGEGEVDEEEEEELDFHMVNMKGNEAYVSAKKELEEEEKAENEAVPLEDMETLEEWTKRNEENRRLEFKKKLEKNRTFKEQILVRNVKQDAPVKGKYVTTERTGIRAKIEKERRERVQRLLAEMEPAMEGKKVLKVDNMTRDFKFMISALLSQMIWAHREIGLSEAKDMLRLLFGPKYSDVHFNDLNQFIHENVKNAKFVNGPTEPHLTIHEGCAWAVLGATARLGRRKPKNLKKVKL